MPNLIKTTLHCDSVSDEEENELITLGPAKKAKLRSSLASNPSSQLPRGHQVESNLCKKKKKNLKKIKKKKLKLSIL
jgi:hypothetical protein